MVPNDPAFTARKDVIVRSLNRAVAFGADKQGSVRQLFTFEDGHSSALL